MTEAVIVPVEALMRLKGCGWPDDLGANIDAMLAAAPKAEPVVGEPEYTPTTVRPYSMPKEESRLAVAVEALERASHELEVLINGLPDYLESENLTDEERVIERAQSALVTIKSDLAQIKGGEA